MRDSNIKGVNVKVFDSKENIPSSTNENFIGMVQNDDKLIMSDGGSTEVYDSISRTVTQTDHGFIEGNVFTINGTTFVNANASTEINSKVVGIVIKIIDSNTFIAIFYSGAKITLTTEQWNPIINSSNGLTPGQTYYLSSSDSGKLTTTIQTINVTVLMALSTTDALFYTNYHSNNIQSYDIEFINSDTTLTDNLKDVYLINCTNSNVTITIQNSDATNNQMVTKFIRYAGNNNAYITTISHAQNINDSPTQQISQNGTGFEIISYYNNGISSKWIILNDTRFLEGAVDGSLTYWNTATKKWESTGNNLRYINENLYVGNKTVVNNKLIGVDIGLSTLENPYLLYYNNFFNYNGMLWVNPVNTNTMLGSQSYNANSEIISIVTGDDAYSKGSFMNFYSATSLLTSALRGWEIGKQPGITNDGHNFTFKWFGGIGSSTTILELNGWLNTINIPGILTISDGTAWHSNNDGAASGLDSDLLDGQEGVYYTNASNLASGAIPADRFTDTSHGNRSGGNLHNTVTTTVNGFMSASDKTKLDGIETNATADMTAAEILTAIKTVDGTSSGLDADLLDGQDSAYYRSATNLNAGTIPAARFNDTSHGNRTGGSLHSIVTTTTNGFMSSTDKTKLDAIEANATTDMTSTEILTAIKTVDGTSSGLDSDLLDGQEGTYYTNASNLSSGTIPTSCFDDTSHGNRSGGDLHTAVSTTINGFMSASDKTKLDSIESNASADMTPNEILTAIKTVDGTTSGLDADLLDGQESAYYRNATNLNAGILPSAQFNDTSHGTRSGGTLHGTVTTTINGFMSASDKTKLDGIESNASADMTAAEILTAIKTVDGTTSGLDADLLDGQESTYYTNATNLSSGTIPTSRFDDTSHGNRSGGNLHATVTTAINGFMSASDKTKLDGVASNANNYIHPSSHPATMITTDTSNRFVTDTQITTWNNKPTQLSQLTDTSIVTPSLNDILQYDGSSWSSSDVNSLLQPNGNWILINANTYAASTVNWSVTGLNGNVDGMYLITFRGQCGATHSLTAQLNASTSGYNEITHYMRTGTLTNVIGSTPPGIELGIANATTDISSQTTLFATSGRNRHAMTDRIFSGVKTLAATSNMLTLSTSTTYYWHTKSSTVWTDTASNITSINFYSSVAITGTISLYKWMNINPSIINTAVNYTAINGNTILVNTTSASRTITLTTQNGAKIVIKKINAANSVIVQASSGTIDGAATNTWTTNYLSKTFVCDGVNWYIV